MRLLTPIYDSWEIRSHAHFMTKAQGELQFLTKRRANDIKSHFEQKLENPSFAFDGTSTAITGASVAAIPLAYKASMVSVGGILGVIGITAISLPIAITSAAVLGTFFVIGGKAARSRQEKFIHNQAEQIFYKNVYENTTSKTSFRTELLNEIEYLARTKMEALNVDCL